MKPFYTKIREPYSRAINFAAELINPVMIFLTPSSPILLFSKLLKKKRNIIGTKVQDLIFNIENKRCKHYKWVANIFNESILLLSRNLCPTVTRC